MELVDLVISRIEANDPRIYQLEWYREITSGLSYPRMSRMADAVKDLRHLLLFYKLVQRDIMKELPEAEQRGVLLILEYYILQALKNRKESSDVWDCICDMTLEEFGEKYSIVIPDLIIQEKTNLIVKKEKTPERMPALLTGDEALLLYRFLQKNNFISMNTSTDSFLYRMGIVGASHDDQRPICWQKNKQLLREMLEMCFASQIENKAITKSTIEKTVPKCFVNRAGKSIILSKNKVEESYDRDLLIKFFKSEG